MSLINWSQQSKAINIAQGEEERAQGEEERAHWVRWSGWRRVLR